MKKFITSAFFAFAVLTASASNNINDINSQASDIARRMANQVELNEMEYIQVKKYTAEKLVRVAQILDMYSNDRDMMTKKIMEEESAYTHRIQNLLTAKQFETYATLYNSYKTNLNIIAVSE
ncbi:hypothetical protein I5M27_05630 [Adhaeribacter sp. BT258]|uniref:DUF4168 domain-containing protein n=1 Tax=Adhaeribacter terrigena TaxID=2793070 RepID=A0ABS1BZV9_9BACT|nr:hypothetical protein [Adhaeribacter terrigena]MBK0402456.1 hypothetical protein [Adhaeribacter terrigena]